MVGSSGALPPLVVLSSVWGSTRFLLFGSQFCCCILSPLRDKLPVHHPSPFWEQELKFQSLLMRFDYLASVTLLRSPFAWVRRWSPPFPPGTPGRLRNASLSALTPYWLACISQSILSASKFPNGIVLSTDPFRHKPLRSALWGRCWLFPCSFPNFVTGSLQKNGT
jgi:hypothetical protein